MYGKKLFGYSLPAAEHSSCLLEAFRPHTFFLWYSNAAKAKNSFEHIPHLKKSPISSSVNDNTISN